MIINLFTMFALLIISNSSYAFFGSGCSDVKRTAPPDWVKLGFNYQEQGYKTGFGEARFQKGVSFTNQLKSAEQLARQDLVNGVHIKIDSSSSISTIVDESHSSEDIKRRLESRVQTRSKIELPGLPIYKKWQSADTCSVFVLVRIHESIIDLVLKKALLTNYLTIANSDEITVKARISAIGEAIEIAKINEFSQIPGSHSSTQMLREFESIKKFLEKLRTLRNHVVYIVNRNNEMSSVDLKELSRKLNSALPGSFETGKQCNSVATCLLQAGQTVASYATVAIISLDTSKQNGFWLGDFNLEISLWDLSNNKRLYTNGNEIARVMNRHKHKLSLKKGYDKWVVQYPSTLSNYRLTAKKVSEY